MNENDAIRMLVHELWNEAPLSMRKLRFGNINIVYEVTTPSEGELIVQLHPDKARVKLFHRGNWGLGLARERGIPVPAVLATGNALIPYAYVAYKKIPGIVGVEYDGDVSKVWRELGLVARRINLVSVPGFGRVGYWKGRHREHYDTWEEHVTQEYEQYGTTSPWITKDVLPDALRDEFRERIAALKSLSFQPKLIHGDIALKNAIVSPEGALAGIIDWDEMILGKAPEQEIAAAFPWITDRERANFLEGYGIGPEEWERRAPLVETFELLKYLEFYTWFAYSRDSRSAFDMRERFIAILEGKAKRFSFSL